ncbi:hypothetical protein AB0L85_29425 [Streptomyces sp. NPDC052051]|uniref:hypothetical protein n=1 Tax=Streptomyces sp. NPDC052051 TaxID=3154649 RepID=UPI003436EF16
MPSVVGLLERCEVAARRRVDGLREETGRIQAGLAVADKGWQKWVIARRRVGRGSRIDGAPLTELIDGFEIAAGMQPAGDAYGGLIPEFFRFGPMQNHFLRRSTNTMGPKTPVLGGECREWECWPLMARIIATADLVTWDSFEQPHRTARDCTAFGPFHFKRPHKTKRCSL